MKRLFLVIIAFLTAAALFAASFGCGAGADWPSPLMDVSAWSIPAENLRIYICERRDNDGMYRKEVYPPLGHSKTAGGHGSPIAPEP
jgi:hypothetical protein